MAFQAYLKSGTKQTRAANAGLAAYYETRNFKPLWVTGTGLSKKAVRLLEFLPNAHIEGLNPRRYETRLLPGYSDDISHLAGDWQAMLQLEAGLSRIAVKYAKDVSGGSINPSRISEHLTPTQPAPTALEALKGIEDASNPAHYLASLAPRHEGYVRLRALLAKARAHADSMRDTRVSPVRKTIKAGRWDKRVAQVRKRLGQTGDYRRNSGAFLLTRRKTSSMQVVMKPDYLDAQLVAAIKKFQRRHGLRPTGAIDRRTVNAMNSSPLRRIRKILVNMERYRWLPRDLGWRHVFVNQADYSMRLVEHGKTVHAARVIIGKPKHPTPVFSNAIKFVVLNPYWNVPKSIIKNEMLPQVGGDPSYLESMGYEVVYQPGRRRSSFSTGLFGWSSRVDPENIDFDVRQPPGPKNALGRVKFLFPNKHNVYLHDTPTKHLFARTTRAYSHGCVRLQNASRFAEILLAKDANWSKARVNRAIASGRNQRIVLKKTVPIHIAYFTAWVDGNGTFQNRPDIYRRDAQLLAALGPQL